MANTRRKTEAVTLAAMLGALSVVLIYLAQILPAGKLAVIALAGLAPAVMVLRFGTASGFSVYVVTALLSLVLAPQTAVAYIVVFGHYPMVKSYIERAKSPFVRWTLKILFCIAVLCALFFGFRAVFDTVLPGVVTALYFPAGAAAFVAYDLGFSALIKAFGGRIAGSGRTR